MSDDLRKTGSMPAAKLIVAARPSLLVSAPAGAYKMPLPENGELTIGRSPECAICVDDTLISRNHAVLRVRDDASVLEVVDLESSNGTRVGERALVAHQPFAVNVGDVISLGATVIVVQAAWSGGRARQVWTHGYFAARVEDECARAEHGGRPFAVVRLRFEHTDPTLEDRLVQHVRPMDVLAAYAPGEYDVLVVDLDADEAERAAVVLAIALGNPRVGVACYPRDGRTPEALLARALPNELASNDRGASTVSASDDAVDEEGAIKKLEPLLRRVATSDLPTLILGETGVGKEVVARMIHQFSPRANGPYVCVNCAAIAETLLESELFGHEKGAFTGATHNKQGLLESADGGTVLLDEIGEMPLSLQVKLLRVLEQREIMKVGAVRPRSIDVRFLAATHRDLESEIARGRFRRDLYFRLAGIELLIPPLRKRIAEIAPLARRFAREAATRAGVKRGPDISDEAISILEGHGWPGNVRELRNVIERAVLLSSTGGRITAAHLPVEKMGAVHLQSPSERAVPIAPPRPPPSPGKVTTRLRAQTSEAVTLEERARVVAALRAARGNQTEAAKILGMSRRTLVSRLDEFELPRPRKDRDEP